MARSVGELLLLTAQSEALPLADARDFCAAVDVFGVAGWRLPKDAELRALRGVLNQRLYWSSQPDGHGDGRAMEGKTGTFHVYLPIEPIAHAACVRRR
jgi:hypothetical protein